MTIARVVNRELGTDSEFAALIEKIEGFDFVASTHTDNLNLARALKVLAKDIVERHRNITALEAKLVEQTSLAEVTAEIGKVLGALSPPRPQPRRKFWLWRRTR